MYKCLVTTEHFITNDIKVLPWPAKSPDLNVVEKIWAWLVEDLYSKEKNANLSQLRDEINNSIARKKKSISQSIKLFFQNYFDKVMDVIIINVFEIFFSLKLTKIIFYVKRKI